MAGREIREDHTIGEDNNASWKLLLKQVVICSASWFAYLVGGITYGIPTVLLPQLKKDVNSTIVVSEDMEGLLKSIFGYASIPWVFFITYLTIVTGRRIPLFFIALTSICGYTLLYCSTTAEHILISEILQSNTLAAATTVSITLISEYAAPKYRGVLLTIKAGTTYWGIWIANAMGTFLPWKSISIFGIVCSLLIMPIIFFPESPSWLASKGRFDECRKAHRWLRGTGSDSEEELEKLIKSQQEYLSNKRLGLRTYCTTTAISSMIKSKEFIRPILLATALTFMYNCSGKLVCVMYSITIIKKITQSEKMAYIGMLILDGITLLGMYSGSAVARYVSRRILLFTSAVATITFLFGLSLYLYLIKLMVLTENNVISVTLLSLLSISTSFGIILVIFSLIGEIVSLKYRSVSMLIISIISSLIYSLVLQPTPYIFRYLGLHGAFFIYGSSLSIFSAICYKYLPETKDKTLLEIEEYFKDTSKTKDSNNGVTEVLLSDTEVEKVNN